jgi:RNA polymerase sigma factor (sigma-70 family)
VVAHGIWACGLNDRFAPSPSSDLLQSRIEVDLWDESAAMNTDRGSTHPLDDPSPPFLNLLDSDPKRAKEQFGDFAYRLLRVCRPRYFALLSVDQQEDAIQEILLHCIEDDCRVLRCYRPQGRPFAAWFMTVASNKARDLWRARRLDREHPIDEVPEAALRDPGPPPRDPLLLKRLMDCMSGMGEKCRVLLTLFLEDFKPAEMAEAAGQLLKLEHFSNRQASDDLRYCKGRLAEAAVAVGIRWP